MRCAWADKMASMITDACCLASMAAFYRMKGESGGDSGKRVGGEWGEREGREWGESGGGECEYLALLATIKKQTQTHN